MKKTFHILPTLILLSAPLFISAHADSMKGMPAEKHAAMLKHKGEGSVNKVDVATGTINLTHGPIKSLDWMGMTMDFKVKNKSNLDKIKVGTKVNFEINKEPDGTFAITNINPVK